MGYIYWEITPEPYRVGLLEEISFKAWPVPAKNEVHFQVDLPNKTIEYQYKIINLSGQMVAQGIFPESGYLTVQRKHMSSGLYLFQLITNTGELVAQSKVVWE